MQSPWAFAANARRHVHNLCVRRVLVRSASVQRGYIRGGAAAIDKIHRFRRGGEGGGKAGKERRRTPALLGQDELCTARECKVHAEQTSRSNASEWTGLRLFLSPISSLVPYAAPYARASRRCLMHVCTRYSKILGAAPRRRRASHEEVSFLSLIPYLIAHRRPRSHPRRSSSFLALSSPLILSCERDFSSPPLSPCIIPVTRRGGILRA